MSLVENLQRSLTLASMIADESQIISITLSFGEVTFHVMEETYEWLMLQNSVPLDEFPSTPPYVHRRGKHVPSGIVLLNVVNTAENKETPSDPH